MVKIVKNSFILWGFDFSELNTSYYYIIVVRVFFARAICSDSIVRVTGL